MSEIYPNGREWQCSRCKTSVPADFGPDHCEVCGGRLTRVMAVLNLPASSHASQHGEPDTAC